ncbi:MAG: Serine/threonine-protein kinase PknD [Acidimicrobiales bacterium]|nr:MAG: serine/threonine protein kinase [Actinomycetota bacterium]MBV6508352.1 Serine/threonine-protein kinase PknD [Acidimicrobiales bacterium]RIK04829.1 MAG: hypothetical protein DCC48_12360 [Acidobacteriota bacterium]
MAEQSPPDIRGGDELAGRTLAGRYRLDSVIAAGGMAQVWRATDTVLGRTVAVKLLHPHLSADATFVERFRQEAIHAARLAHPAIVSIFDTCSGDGWEAIVMELVDGITLREYLDREGVLDPARTVEIGAQVADALEAAHRAGVIHRDIKPANILLCDDRRVMVADFGIAKAVDRTDLTRQGTMIGTAKYLAPEQVEGTDVDGRADIFSLGVVLYECLTGRTPFSGDTDAAVALARLHSDPLRPRQVRADIPKRLDALVMRSLARDRNQRHPSAAALRADLLDQSRATASPEPPEVTEPSTPPGGTPTFVQSERRWLVPALLILIVAGGLGLAGILLGQTKAGQDLFERAKEAIGLDNDSGADQAEQVGITEVVAFDPQGSGPPGENDGLTGYMVDGDPATTWRTESYDERDFGTKEGVGAYFVLDGSRSLSELRVTSPTIGWAADVYVLDHPPEPAGVSGSPVASASGLSGEVTFDLGGADGSVALLWITDLGDGPPDPRVRVEIAEVSIWG